MPEITQDEAIKIIHKINEKSLNDDRCHDMWQIIDYINGLGFTTVTGIVEILESLDQKDEDVKELRKYLKL